MTPDVHTLTGAYALDALENVERGDFEQHLAECPHCTDEVAEFLETAARLALAVDEAPPERMRQRVLTVITTVRQEPPAVDPADNVIDLAAHAARRKWVTRITTAAAVVAIAVAIGVGIDAQHEHNQLQTAEGQLSQQEQQYAPVAELLAAPDVSMVTGTAATGGSGALIVSKKLNEAVFVASNMPVQPNDRTYQLWAIGTTGSPRSAGVLTANASGAVNPVLVSTLDNTATLAVTVEPAGGSKQPTTTPIMAVSLPA
ncbi:MAG TPA: anti-sigma factor [Pseudonocardiaceae bacterium]|jgi:anti-sigma-K factor RskA|nr:anti-sigma factor [Pseudonocardiaceae bacterium]